MQPRKERLTLEGPRILNKVRRRQEYEHCSSKSLRLIRYPSQPKITDMQRRVEDAKSYASMLEGARLHAASSTGVQERKKEAI